jgi:hypothetical protein
MEELARIIDEHLSKLEEFCIATLAEVGTMRLQVKLLKETLNK